MDSNLFTGTFLRLRMQAALATQANSQVPASGVFIEQLLTMLPTAATAATDFHWDLRVDALS